MFTDSIELLKLLAVVVTLALGVGGIFFAKRRDDGSLTTWGRAVVALLCVSFVAAVGMQWVSYNKDQERAARAAAEAKDLRTRLATANAQLERVMTAFNPYELRLGFTGRLPVDHPFFNVLRQEWHEILLSRYLEQQQIIAGDSGTIKIGPTNLLINERHEAFPSAEHHGHAAFIDYIQRINIDLRIFKTPLSLDTLRHRSEFATAQPDLRIWFPGPTKWLHDRGERGVSLSLNNDLQSLSEYVEPVLADVPAEPLGGGNINSIRDLVGAQMIIQITGYPPAVPTTELEQLFVDAWNMTEVRQLELFTGSRTMRFSWRNMEQVVNDEGDRLYVFHFTNDIDSLLPTLKTIH